MSYLRLIIFKDYLLLFQLFMLNCVQSVQRTDQTSLPRKIQIIMEKLQRLQKFPLKWQKELRSCRTWEAQFAKEHRWSTDNCILTVYPEPKSICTYYNWNVLVKPQHFWIICSKFLMRLWKLRFILDAFLKIEVWVIKK